ncbi:MAG: RHS repeat-associated core domain-containing protein, partial [Oscillospiraceae bacterium]|nr:RHS repeat-associated core domain-containing protein [Oscillospiraceae bacterium]
GNSCTTSGQIATWKNSRYNNLGDGSLVGATTYSYTYDGRGNITAISDGTNTTAYEYDAKSQLTRENNQAANKTWVYAYDNGGNITSKTEYAYTTATNPSSPTSTKTYTYGDTSWKDLLTGYDGATLTYDAVGNLTGDGTWTYTWQHGRQLASAGNGTKSLTYAYNADGQRISKTVVNSGNTTETKYYYAGDKLTKLTRGDVTLTFSYDSLGPRSVTYNGSNYYYLRNAQGDILGIVSAYGAVIASYTYDAWGNIVATSGSMINTLGSYNPFRYRGYVYDNENKLYYLNTRYYNPAVGRFISADIFVSTGQGVLGSNMYAYCGNNPVNMADPNGELFFTLLGAATGFIGSAVVSLLQGNDISKAVNDGVCGAVGGAIAGFGVDAALVTVGTGGAAAPFAAFGIAYVFGGAGNVITTEMISDGKASTDEYIASFIIGGTFNAISLGTSWDCAAKTFKGVAIKAALNTTENEIVGTCTALAAGVATHIGTTIARECNRVQVGAVRRAVQ